MHDILKYLAGKLYAPSPIGAYNYQMVQRLAREEPAGAILLSARGAA